MGLGSKVTLAGRLAEFFLSNQGRWVDGRDLAPIAGAYAWRTRVSELRKSPYRMDVQNRRRLMTQEGRRWVVSEYCYQPIVEVPCDPI